MPRVILSERFDWRIPGKRAMMSWPPGEHMLTTAQAEAAKTAGVARPVPKKKGPDDGADAH